jgi:glycosyltransferase involved in cell wall biosynthesis
MKPYGWTEVGGLLLLENNSAGIKRMRVVLDLRSAHPRLTGIGRYAVNLCLSLERIKEGVSLEVICTEGGVDYLQELIRSKINVVPGGSHDWEDFLLPDLLSRLDADLYHSPFFALPKVQACPSLCTVHDVIPMARPDLSSPSFTQLFHKHIGRVLAQASHVVTVSTFSKEDIVRFFPEAEGRVTVIHEPVSPLFQKRGPLECASTLEKYGLSNGFILFVGAVDRRKNLSILLEAHALLLGERSVVSPLVIVGGPSGDGYDLAEELERHGLKGKVHPLGRVSDSELACLYSSAKLFVFPSLYEGFGLPVLEAMASGIPVVTSRVTSLPEVAGEAAMLVDPSNARELSDVMAKVMENAELRASLIAKGLARASEFSLERQGSQLLALYRRILGEAA